LQRPMDREVDEGDSGEVELLDGTVRRGEPEQLERIWERGPILESGDSHS